MVRRRFEGSGRFIHSSRPVGAMSQETVRAPIQYSRRWPPGWGSGVGNCRLSTGSRRAAAGRGSAAAAASTLATSFGDRTRTVSPPIVQRKVGAARRQEVAPA